MLRQATPADGAMIDAFLASHSETSMFLRGNLAEHGVGLSEAPHSTRYFVWETPDIGAVFGLSKGGFLLAQAEGAPGAAFLQFADHIRGERVLGMTGAVASVSNTLAALGLETADYKLLHDEPLYALDLEDVTAGAALRSPTQSDRLLLERWFVEYEIDTGLSDPEAAKSNAIDRAEAAIQPNSPVRLMTDADGTPIAMAAFNARVADLVQIGGVFVPRDRRNRGLGRSVTAALLVEARERGARRAILFANNAPAACAYEALGFARIGDYRVAILAHAQIIGEAA